MHAMLHHRVSCLQRGLDVEDVARGARAAAADFPVVHLRGVCAALPLSCSVVHLRDVCSTCPDLTLSGPVCLFTAPLGAGCIPHACQQARVHAAPVWAHMHCAANLSSCTAWHMHVCRACLGMLPMHTSKRPGHVAACDPAQAQAHAHTHACIPSTHR